MKKTKKIIVDNLPVKLDLRDERLLLLLKENARATISELAKRLGVNRDTLTNGISNGVCLQAILKISTES